MLRASRSCPDQPREERDQRQRHGHHERGRRVHANDGREHDHRHRHRQRELREGAREAGLERLDAARGRRREVAGARRSQQERTGVEDGREQASTELRPGCARGRRSAVLHEAGEEGACARDEHEPDERRPHVGEIRPLHDGGQHVGEEQRLADDAARREDPCRGADAQLAASRRQLADEAACDRGHARWPAAALERLVTKGNAMQRPRPRARARRWARGTRRRSARLGACA
jgi:hypothetical protein